MHRSRSLSSNVVMETNEVIALPPMLARSVKIYQIKYCIMMAMMNYTINHSQFPQMAR